MNILIVAATEFELLDFKNYIQEQHLSFLEKELYIDFLITGVGMMQTTYQLTNYFNEHNCDVAIQAGIAGSFRQGIAIGDIVKVDSEAMGDLGAEDKEGFLDVYDLNLMEINAKPFERKLLFASETLPINIGKELKKVQGITVNATAGVENTIAIRRKKYAADIETMEGAAFHFVCLQEAIPFVQIRAISNYIIPRDTSQWKIKQSIDRLNEYLISSFSKL